MIRWKMIKHNGGGSLYQGPTYSRLVALVAIGVRQGQFAFNLLAITFVYDEV